MDGLRRNLVRVEIAVGLQRKLGFDLLPLVISLALLSQGNQDSELFENLRDGRFLHHLPVALRNQAFLPALEHTTTKGLDVQAQRLAAVRLNVAEVVFSRTCAGFLLAAIGEEITHHELVTAVVVAQEDKLT